MAFYHNFLYVSSLPVKYFDKRNKRIKEKG